MALPSDRLCAPPPGAPQTDTSERSSTDSRHAQPSAPLIDPPDRALTAPPDRALTERPDAPRPSTRLASATRRGPGAGALALAALLGTVPAAPGRAQEAPVPACEAATAGQLSSQAGVRCACRFLPASGLAATAAGYRWDCGILRARLDHDLLVDLNPYPYPLPEALSIERAIVPELPPDRPWPRR